MMLLDHYLDGAFYPKGGSAVLRDAFVTVLRQKHVVLKNRTPVTGIHRSGAEFIVTSRSGETFSARTVISNVDPLIAFRELIDPGIIPRKIKKMVSHLRPSGGSFYAFIGTRLDPAMAGITDANIIHFEYTDVNRTFAAVADRRVSEPFPYFFITSPSLKDPDNQHAPEDCHTLEIISGLGDEHPFSPWSGTESRRRGDDYTRLKNQVGMCLVRSAERYIPDLGNHLDYVEFATPLSNAYWVNSFNGGNFGPEQTPDQFGPGRFFDCKAGVEGLFVVGAGAISAGVLSCIASGVWAANQAVEFLG
jgi:all-trans-retinol 13,14-reductase